MDFEQFKTYFDNDDEFLSFSNFCIFRTEIEDLIQNIKSLENIFFKKDIREALTQIEDFYKNLDEKRSQLNEKFFEKEKQRAWSIFHDSCGNELLTHEQVRAVLCNDDRNLIIAGAGSGKTRVIDFKVRYLVNYKGINPRKIVLLSFSKKSAGDLAKKVSENVKGVQVRTIHSFAAQAVKKNRKILFDPQKKELEYFVLRALAETLKEGLYLENLFDFYYHFFSQIKPLIFYNSLTELRKDLKKSNSKLIPINDKFEEVKARRTLRTLKGDYVRSIDELYIADFLYLNDINYQYEKRYPYSKEFYFPDFYLIDYDIYLEHFAITSRGTPPPFFKNPKKYIDGISWKRKVHEDNNTRMLESFSYLLNEGKSSDYLSSILAAGGVKLKNSPKDEMSLKKISNSFCKLFTKFYNTYKLSGLNIKDLKAKYTNIEFRLFLIVFEGFLESFERLASNHNRRDFTDLLIDAIVEYETGYAEGFDYIIVDEFQDTSKMAMKLLDAVCKVGNDTSMLSVGDDWQSIYGFNGSDVSILSDYENSYSGVHIEKLNNNFRSHPRIVEFGKKFISKNPAQIKKDVVSKGSSFEKSKISFINFSEMEKEIQSIPGDESIFVLYRYNSNCPANKGIFTQYFTYKDNKPAKKKRAKKDITLMTIHRSKGLEARHVFILFPDGVSQKFPSEIEDHFIFDMLKSKSDTFPFSEERRLMYVAITRAQQNLYFVTPTGKDPNSIFWDELKELNKEQTPPFDA